MRVWIVALVLLLASTTADAQVTRDQLLEMTAAGTDPALILSVVERDCVDFEIDAGTLVELTPLVPKEVLQAAMSCRAEAVVPETFECRVYRALTDDPSLADFPVVLDDNHKGRLTLLELDIDAWFAETSKARGFKARFKAIGAHGARHIAAANAVRALPGVRDVHFLSDATLSKDELQAQQQLAILAACAVRARVTLTSEPAGALVYVDDDYAGETPLDLEILPGERSIRIEAETFAPHVEQLLLDNGETREITIALEPLARVHVESVPPGAMVTVDGDFIGHAPLEFFADNGEHQLRVVAPGHLPFETTVDTQRGEVGSIPASLSAAEGYCHEEPVTGTLAAVAKSLDRLLRGKTLTQMVPLYRVLSSTTEREQSSTHVVDGRQILFEPQAGNQYEDSPWKLLGRDLGGMGFGETAVDVLSSPPGRVTVTDVERKKSTIIVETRHQDGNTNKVYFDFTQALDQLPASAFLDALCLVFARHPAPTATP